MANIKLWIGVGLFLVISGLTWTIDIEGQLMVIRNDCYERLAIGERLNPETVYKTIAHNTLEDCKQECTKDKENCRAYSIGIGLKGNGTCELSHDPVKESADLKPVGTIHDTDYDLYIKKLDCQMVIEQPNYGGGGPGIRRPQFNSAKPPYTIEKDHYRPNHHGYDGATSGYHQNAVQYGYNSKPQYDFDKHYHNNRPSYHGDRDRPDYGRPQDGYDYPKPSQNFPKPYPQPNQRPPNENVQQVQTMVSIAHGPDSFLHPVHDIIVSNGNNPNDPQRPHSGNHPPPSYGTHHKKPPSRPLIPTDTNYNRPYEDNPKLPSLSSYDDKRRPELYPHPPKRPEGTLYGESNPVISNRPYGGNRQPPPPLDSYYGDKHRPVLQAHPPELPYNDDRRRPELPPQHESSYGGPPKRPPIRPLPPPQNPYGQTDSHTRPRPDVFVNPNNGLDHAYGQNHKPLSNGYESGRPMLGHMVGIYGDQGSAFLESFDYGGEYGGYSYHKPPLIPYLPMDPDRPDPQYAGVPNYFNPMSTPYGNGGDVSGDGGAQFLSVNRRKYDLYGEESHSFVDFPLRRPAAPGPNNRPINNNFYDRYEKPFPDRPTRYGSLIPHPNDYDNNHKPGQHYDKTQYYDYLFKPGTKDRYEIDLRFVAEEKSLGETNEQNSKNTNLTTTSADKTPSAKDPTNKDDSEDFGKKNNGAVQNSIVSHSIDKKGQHITSIITLIEKACFKRAFAGKRIIRGLVRELILCDTVEQCQQECADTKVFTCEGFNYRIDPSGRGKGECELLDLPLSKINIPRELVMDEDYDVYIRDRNAAASNCQQPPSGSTYFPDSIEEDYDYKGSHRYADSYEYDDVFERKGTIPYRPSPPLKPLPAPPPPPARRHPPPNDLDPVLRRPGDRWKGDDYLGPKPRPEPPVDGYLISGPRPGPEIDRRHDFDRRPDPSPGREYLTHHTSHHSHGNYESHSFHHNKYHDTNIDRNYYQGHTPGIHYLPASRPYHHDQIPPEPYIPRPPSKPDIWGIDRRNWGSYGGTYGNFGDRKSFYGDIDKYRDQNRIDENRRITYLPVPPPPKDWGLYGGSYGNGGASLQYQGFGDKHSSSHWGFHKNQESNYENDRNFITVKKPPYLPIQPIVQELDNFILPVEPRRPLPPNFIKDECSLRMAQGARLHKRVLKKFFVVPNIYECELLCFKEREFQCSSYAFRYTVNLNSPSENCHLSDRNFKELDYYTDLEPEKDFDVYTMNNREKCQGPDILREKDHSECFWRVRSGQRLDHIVVRDSLKVNSIVECQLECLKTKRFTCRAYSFRYGSPTIGGIIDNCQLTNWPFYELDPQRHFISEPDFEIYERGSFGHGCQPDHFRISGKHVDQDVKTDTICYIGFAQAARLLPAATIKSLFVPTELDCKNECSKLRERSTLRCMTFSFRSGGSPVQSNCYLSHIMQRDLLPKVDYIEDPTSWLFTWDNYNPECFDGKKKKPPGIHYDDFDEEPRRIFPGNGGFDLDFYNPVDTWRVYSVNGWPCRRGSTCQENVEAGFWFCYLDGQDKTAWDYCCRPGHQCGLSRDYPYEWCYVGPERTQWRKCSDRYYPYYYYNNIDRFEQVVPPKPWHPNGDYLKPPPFRPDRPPAEPTPAPSRPSLDQYEDQFDSQFLGPPKPGGFGMPRRWPVSYLHKEMPPNSTESSPKKVEEKNSKISAIKNLINVIKSNDFNNVEYHIANNSNKEDDVLFVKIALPSNLTEISTVATTVPSSNKQQVTSKKPDIKIKSSSVRTQKSINNSTPSQRNSKSLNKQESRENFSFESIFGEQSVSQRPSQSEKQQENVDSKNWRESLFQRNNSAPVYRKGYVTRTNITRTRRFDLEFL